MAYVTAVILCCQFLIVVANEESGSSISCEGNMNHENNLDGYKFLEEGVKFHIVMTSLPAVFTVPGGTSARCITTVTTAKNDDTREVTETVYYKDGASEAWQRFSQTFQFYADSGRYNRMNNTELSGAPSGTYSFMFTNKGCAVVTVANFGSRLPGDTESDNAEDSAASAAGTVEERQSGDQSSGNLECIVWERDGNTHATQNFCENYFSKCCKSKYKEYEYNSATCALTVDKEDL
uniref:Lipocalin n=1 Tax=Rhipicephalus zambeziensis TaxID=60191 RepID=A0A224YN69_9ACAR